jgi:aminopeptidase N
MLILLLILLLCLFALLIGLAVAAFRLLRRPDKANTRRQGYIALGCFALAAVAACLVMALGAGCYASSRALPALVGIQSHPPITTPADHLRPAPTPVPVISHPGSTEHLAASMIPPERPSLDRLDDPPRYTLDAAILWDQATVTGRQQVLLTNNEAESLETVVFRLYPNAPYYEEGNLAVESVEVDGAPAQFGLEQDETVLVVTLPAPLPPEAQASLAFDFTLTVPRRPDRFGVDQDVMVLGHWYPMLSVYDDEGWHTDPYVPMGDAFYTEASHYTLRLTLPATMTVAATGVETARRDNGDDTVTVTYQGGAARDLVAVISPLFETISTTVGETTITSFYLPGDQAGGQQALDVAAGSVRVFNERIGLYPYTDLEIVEGHFLINGSPGGMEFSGLVLISTEFYDPDGPYAMMDTPAMVVSHEVAHQWWYGVIGNDQVDDPWLDEAFAVYSSLLYFEADKGEKAMRTQLWMNSTLPYKLVAAAGGDRPIATSLLDMGDDSLSYSAIVYGKGGLFLGKLRRALGDERFGELLQSYYAGHRFGIVRPYDFYAAVLDAAGDEDRQQKVEELYDDWVLGAIKGIDDPRGLIELLR